MARRSLFERAGSELDREGSKLAGELKAQPSAIHRQTVNVMTHLMGMGKQMSGDTTPAHLRVIMRTLERSQPLLLEGISTVPPASIKQFMTELRDMIQTILDTPDEGPARDGQASATGPEAQPDIAQGA